MSTTLLRSFGGFKMAEAKVEQHLGPGASVNNRRRHLSSIITLNSSYMTGPSHALTSNQSVNIESYATRINSLKQSKLVNAQATP